MIDESTWIESLAREAKRDLVFLWYITGGRIGGEKPTPEEAPSLISRVANGLIAHGCAVGFGDPDGPSWEVPAELAGSLTGKGEVIAKLWLTNPKAYEFLVFAHREAEGLLLRAGTRSDA